MAALLNMVVSGGIQGGLARQALRRSLYGFLMISTAFAIYEKTNGEDASEEHVLQIIWNHVNPASPEVATWKIGDTNLGPGTKLRSLLKLAGKALTEPTSLNPFISMDEMNQNPIYAFARGNLSPVLSDSIEVVTGSTYIGEPVPVTDILQGDFSAENFKDVATNLIAPDVMPIWIKSLVS